MPPKKVTPTSKTASKPTGKAPGKGTTAKKADSGSKPAAKGAAAAPPPPPPPPEVTTINFKQLNGVVEDSTKGKIKESKKWPLIIDLQGNVSTFLKYRNANYIQAGLPGEMAPEKLRMALLGALRYGKPLVIDVEEGNINCIQAPLEEVEKGLLESLLTHALLQDEKFMSLHRPTDSKEYEQSFCYETDGFCFIVVTTQTEPDPSLASRFTCIKVE